VSAQLKASLFFSIVLGQLCWKGLEEDVRKEWEQEHIQELETLAKYWRNPPRTFFVRHRNLTLSPRRHFLTQYRSFELKFEKGYVDTIWVWHYTSRPLTL